MSNTYIERHRRAPFSRRHSTEQRISRCEVDVLAFLLDQERPPTRVQLEHEIDGDPLDLSNALDNLAAAGLLDLSERSVTLTRRARLTRQTVADTLAVSGSCTRSVCSAPARSPPPSRVARSDRYVASSRRVSSESMRIEVRR